MDKIQTFGNKCFNQRAIVATSIPQKPFGKKILVPKPERVNLKLGKIRVTVSGAKKIRVAQDGDAMIIILDELLSSTTEAEQQPQES